MLQALFLGGIVAFGTHQAWKTRAAAGSGAGSEEPSGAAALVEAPSIGFSVYNMVFTSVLFYPSATKATSMLMLMDDP